MQRCAPAAAKRPATRHASAAAPRRRSPLQSSSAAAPAAGSHDRTAGAPPHTKRDRRAQLAHLKLVDPADMSRFDRLGAIASAQTPWTAAREEQQQRYRDLLGNKRAARNCPFRSMRDAGVMLAAGSDWSVSTMDPMQIIQTGVTYLPTDQPDSPPWNPHERLDLLTMLEAYTVNTAYAPRFDDCTGSLEAGKDASFAILDRNPFAPPVETFAQTRAIEASLRGEIVYAAPGWAD
ncbi:amidohydrolase family protein [Burkholderia sp. MS455]|uniref:amidohydrolase family protein n=1 Tax=Burkholderia sp. MS455 TaxID=2811788 RepID=UPI001EF50C36|nr:amidohydrolase family protein [Burkholderia sp. MS455]